MEKCRYYNDHRTCCILFLDDFSLTATSIDGKIYPANDWGYALFSGNSLFSYLYETLFRKYPEIKGTIFLPLKKHGCQNENAGYKVFFRDFDSDFREFFDLVSDRFEIGFHGIHHGRFKDAKNPSFKGWKNEFEYFDASSAGMIKTEISRIESLLDIKIRGGKAPGYIQNESAIGIIKELGFSWWLSSAGMMNRKAKENLPYYLDREGDILHIPTNISGDIFDERILTYGKYSRPMSVIKYIKTHFSLFRNKAFLSYLYEKGIPVTIQEHCQNLRTDGKRQPYNIYDDISSLERIFDALRGYDIWYANCSELAQYFDSFENTEIKPLNHDHDHDFEIIYSGKHINPAISIKTQAGQIFDTKRRIEYKGIFKKGCYIFNNLIPGIYRLL